MAEADSDIVLYDAVGVPSPRRVKMCMAEKRLAFTSRFLNIGMMDQKRQEYLDINPTGMVPTLVHKGQIVYDSNVINEYLNDCFPEPPLVPENPLDRARMRMWFAFEADFARPFRDASYETMGKARVKNAGLDKAQLMEIITSKTSNPFYSSLVLSLLETPTNEAVIAEKLLLIFEKMAGLERALSDGRTWLCGADFTLADIAVAPRLDQFPVIGVDDFAVRYPAAGAWLERVKARPSWQLSLTVPPPGETQLRVDFSPA